MRHQDKQKLLELLDARGWSISDPRMIGSRSKGRAQVNVRLARDECVEVFSVISRTHAVRAFWFARPVGRGWHDRLVQRLEELAAQINGPAVVLSDDIVEREPGEGPWPTLASSVMGYVKHVRCEGARRHVLFPLLSYGLATVTRCSEPYCVYNAPAPTPAPATSGGPP